MHPIIADGLRGFVVATHRNWTKYIIKTNGRNSNIVNFFDKAHISKLGNPKWWVRFDRPHGNVNFNHININKAITGVTDPHIKINPITAQIFGILGKVAEKTNQIAPAFAAATLLFEAYQISKEVKKDIDHNTTRNTVEVLATKVGEYSAGSASAYAGTQK